MPLVITITDINVDREFRVWAVDNPDGTVTVFGAIGFTYTGGEQQGLRGSEFAELTGTAKQRAAALFDDIKAAVKAKRGIV